MSGEKEKGGVSKWALLAIGTAVAGSAIVALWYWRNPPPGAVQKSKRVLKHKTRTVQTQKSPRYQLVEQFGEAYGFTTDELKIKLKSYLEGDKLPFLDRTEFEAIMHKLNIVDDHIIEKYLHSGHLFVMLKMVLLLSTFRTWDLNRDGKIDFSELMLNMVRIAKGSVEDKLRFVFHAHDLDGDGFLTTDELFSVYRSLLRSEGLATDEIELERKVVRMVDEILTKFDRNHDAAVSEEEFIHIVGLEDLEMRSFSHLANEMLFKFGVTIEGTSSEQVHS
eukprot:TRINITY_DN6977_c0_g1_i2.p1 TRINITY_DN6977_c0_g1~~TRINITY_DN6977_c0_g1_i2.p1  ORF type:complete len:278 (-),score=83.94 TRINITY_DN6977_c0_g1_i2:56-889(-)